jgi:hypothetical protein
MNAGRDGLCENDQNVLKRSQVELFCNVSVEGQIWKLIQKANRGRSDRVMTVASFFFKKLSFRF